MRESTLDFQKIHDDFRSKIHRYLARLVGEFEAEDLTQEVFVRVNRALPEFRGESQLSTWIYRIATNAAMDRLRQPSFQQMLHHQPLEGSSEDETEVGDQDVWTGEPAPTLEQQLHRKEGYACFCDFIENLPQNYRLLLALDQIGEYTAREIAEILGLDLDVVKIRLHRGRGRLLQELKKHCKAEDWL